MRAPSPCVCDALASERAYEERTKTMTFSNGCLGSCNDEERSEMRYVVRIAEYSESSNSRTHAALPVGREHVCLSVCCPPLTPACVRAMVRVGAARLDLWGVLGPASAAGVSALKWMRARTPGAAPVRGARVRVRWPPMRVRGSGVATSPGAGAPAGPLWWVVLSASAAARLESAGIGVGLPCSAVCVARCVPSCAE